MSIAKSLRKAGYLRPVSGAVGNYLESLNKQRQQEEDQEKFNQLVNEARQQIEFGTPSPLLESQNDDPRTRGAKALFDFTAGIGELEGVPNQQKAQTGGALSQLAKSYQPKVPKEVKTEPYKVGDKVFGRGPSGKIDFSKPLYESPAEEKLFELSPGERLVGPDGKVIAEGGKREPRQTKPTVVGGSYVNGRWVEELSNGGKRMTRYKEPKSQLDKDLFKTRKELNALENEKPDKDGYYQNDDTIEDRKARINSIKNDLKFLQKEKIKAKKYFNDSDISEIEKYKKQGIKVDDIIKKANLKGEEAEALRELYRGLGG